MENDYLRIAAFQEQSKRRSIDRKAKSAFGSFLSKRAEMLEEEIFHRMLRLERRRAERSRKPFVLMLLDASRVIEARTEHSFASKTTSALVTSTRETDLVGWYKKSIVWGLIFTEISCEGKDSIAELLLAKVLNALRDALGEEVISKLIVTVHLFPENRDPNGTEPLVDASFYPDLLKEGSENHLPRIVKRMVDIAGSGLLLLLASPLFAAIAMAIKLTSNGPVIFKQRRLGQHGTHFSCLKFRTMYANNDPKTHREYIRRFIAGQPNAERSDPEKPRIYKITNDSRVTPVGRFLRKTSLDELPQFWNVLKGEMSLVGPRPPVPYEFEAYDLWHRRRVLEAKPGITGLWQVSGRSRTSFDDMVRMDLRYSQSWSLWLDLRILIATPRAVLSGEGAY